VGGRGGREGPRHRGAKLRRALASRPQGRAAWGGQPVTEHKRRIAGREGDSERKQPAAEGHAAMSPASGERNSARTSPLSMAEAHPDENRHAHRPSQWATSQVRAEEQEPGTHR
jgi:hypothetical protein